MDGIGAGRVAGVERGGSAPVVSGIVEAEIAVDDGGRAQVEVEVAVDFPGDTGGAAVSAAEASVADQGHVAADADAVAEANRAVEFCRNAVAGKEEVIRDLLAAGGKI